MRTGPGGKGMRVIRMKQLIASGSIETEDKERYDADLTAAAEKGRRSRSSSKKLRRFSINQTLLMQ